MIPRGAGRVHDAHALHGARRSSGHDGTRDPTLARHLSA